MTSPKVGAESKNSVSKTEIMSPQDLKTLFEALNIAPAWISKRFVLKKYCGWTDEDINNNATMKTDEEQQTRIGNKVGGFR